MKGKELGWRTLVDAGLPEKDPYKFQSLFHSWKFTASPEAFRKIARIAPKTGHDSFAKALLASHQYVWWRAALRKNPVTPWEDLTYWQRLLVFVGIRQHPRDAHHLRAMELIGAAFEQDPHEIIVADHLSEEELASYTMVMRSHIRYLQTGDVTHLKEAVELAAVSDWGSEVHDFTHDDLTNALAWGELSDHAKAWARWEISRRNAELKAMLPSDEIHF